MFTREIGRSTSFSWSSLEGTVSFSGPFFFSGQAKHLAEHFAQLASSRLVLDLGLFSLFSPFYRC